MAAYGSMAGAPPVVAPLSMAREHAAAVQQTRALAREGKAEAAYAGCHRCSGCCLADALPLHIYFVNCGCCLWGIWMCAYLPNPLGLVTYCMCREGDVFINQKAGIKTNELLVTDAKTLELGMYHVECGSTTLDPAQEPDCLCTKGL